MKVKEYSIQTKNFEEHFDDRQDSKEFWNNLSQQEKQSRQFFSKTWIQVNNDWIEDDVTILN